jgi:hypothetical protein
MTKPKPKPPDDPEQSRRFIETAKELEADESGRVFEQVVKAARTPAHAKSPPPAKRAAGKKPRSG